MTGLVATHSVVIRASPGRVWKALTDPAMISQYLFGTEAVSDWRAGSPIRYRGTYQGKTYEDKGVVLISEPGKLLETTYWSSMSGLLDKPEHYRKVRFKLTPQKGGTLLTLTQDNNATGEEQAHAEGNWKMLLEAEEGR